MSAIWAIGNNPRRKRRSKRRAKRRMTAKQAQYFAPKRRRSRRRGGRTVARRSRRRSSGRSFSTGNAMSLLKAGAIGGAGAVLVDIGMGQVNGILAQAAPSLASPTNAAGGLNYGYYGVKAALAVALGTWGGKVLPSGVAERMGEGALTVLAYQFIRPMVPATMVMGRVGYVNPAPTTRRIAGTGKYLSGVGAYQNTGTGRGASAARVVALRG